METCSRLNTVTANRERAAYRLVSLLVFGVLAIPVLLLQQAEVSSEQADGIVLWGRLLPEMCIFKHITGKPCPGCGMTRAMVRLLDGHIAQARMIHPSAPWFGMWLGVQLLARLLIAVFPSRSRKLWLADLILSPATLLAATYIPIIHSRLA